MKEEYRKRLLANSYGINVDTTRVPYVGVHNVPDKQEDKNSILKVVFARDKETGKPRNDLAFAHDSHLPQNVRDFISQNLQAPCQPEKGCKDYDLCVELTRHPNETLFDYQTRLTKIAYDSESQIKAASKSVSRVSKRK